MPEYIIPPNLEKKVYKVPHIEIVAFFGHFIFY